MVPFVLPLHSLFRWLVLSSLVYTILRAWIGLQSRRPFTRADDAFRHWTATIAHIQLVIGCILYFTSPLVKLFFSHYKGDPITRGELTFFGVVHVSLMITSIVIITIGSALAKRKEADRDKFRTLLLWFTIALVLLFVAIPWPFSPYAGRPLFRTF